MGPRQDAQTLHIIVAPGHDHRCGESVERFFLQYRFTTEPPEKTDDIKPFAQEVYWMTYRLRSRNRKVEVRFGWKRVSQAYDNVQCLCGQKP